MHYRAMMILLLLTLTSYHANAEDMSSKVENLGTLRSLSIPEIKVRTVNNLLQVQVNLQNTSIYDQEVFYRLKWLDADGFEAAEPDAWKMLKLIGKQKYVVNTFAPTPNAKDFKVEVQAPHNKSLLNPL
jgi:uncharacterized protein YcfL